MPTSRITSLSKPTVGTRVPAATQAYLRARNKRKAYDLVIKEFKKSKLSNAELALRLGRGADRVCKILAGPSNWTLDTMSDVLFAISGAEPVYGLQYPLDKPKRNYLGKDRYNREETGSDSNPIKVGPGEERDRSATNTNKISVKVLEDA